MLTMQSINENTVKANTAAVFNSFKKEHSVM